MRVRTWNILALTILLAALAVFASKPSERNPSADKSPTVVRSHPPFEARSSDSLTLRNESRLPLVAKGNPPSPGVDITSTSYEITVAGTLWQLDHGGLARYPDGVRETVPLRNSEVGYFCGFAYDSKRGNLAVASSAGQGYLDFYKIAEEKWLQCLPLDRKDFSSLVYDPRRDLFFASEMTFGDDLVHKIYQIDPEGSGLQSVPLSIPIPARSPRLVVDEKLLKLVDGSKEYFIDPSGGEVTADFVERYQGEQATLVSIYEVTGMGHHNPGRFQVTVEPSAAPVLVLNSYEPVEWTVEGGEHLERVLVSSYYDSEVKGLPSTCKLEKRSYEADGNFLKIAHTVQSYEMQSLLIQLENEGIGVTSIAAGYDAKEAVIR